MDAMLELSRTGLGLVAVCDAQQQVQGVFTDGDLRRWLVGGALTTPVNEAMTVGGTTSAGAKPRHQRQRDPDEAQNHRRTGGR